MAKKNDERNIGEIFIKEYNTLNSCQFKIDDHYLSSRDESDFPDLKFCNGKELSAEVVRAISSKIEKEKNNDADIDLIEVDPHKEIFIAIEKKESKHYSNAENIILLIHLSFYTEDIDVNSIVSTIRSKGYKFREVWAVWCDETKTPIKLV